MLVLATFFPTSDVPPGYIDVPGVGWLIFQGNLNEPAAVCFLSLRETFWLS